MDIKKVFPPRTPESQLQNDNIHYFIMLALEAYNNAMTGTKKKLGTNYINLSLSHGTMITDDIFRAVSYLLPEHMQEAYSSMDEEGRTSYLNEEIWDYLNDIAPDGCYFGAHPGDGCDYGFWENDDDEEDC